jgi:hypothetical protein
MTQLCDWILRKLKRAAVYLAWFWMRHLPHPWNVFWLCWVLDHARWFVVVRPRGAR